jgi:putative DNA primase/helicase
MTPTTALRHQLCAAGYVPLPLIGKRPVLKDWQKRTDASPGDVDIWEGLYPAATNTGALTRLMPTFDIDITNPDAAEAVEGMVRERFEERGHIPCRVGKAPKRAIPFRTNTPFPKITGAIIAPDGSADQKIEFLCDGQQVVLAGIHPDTGKPYAWHYGTPGPVRLDDLAYISADEAKVLVDDAIELLVRDHGYSRPPDKTQGNGAAGTPEHWADLLANIAAGRELHDSIVSLAAKLILSGMDDRAAANFLRAALENSAAPRDERYQARLKEIGAAVGSARRKFRSTSSSASSGPAGPTAATTRPVIEIAGDRLVANTIHAEAAIIADSRNTPVFQRGGLLVRILRLEQAELQHGISRAAAAPLISAVTSEWLRCRLNEAVHFVKKDGRARGLVDKDPPAEYATALLNRSGDWKFPQLHGVIEAPTLRADGSILQSAGYDRTTGLYFDPGPATFDPIPTDPDRDDALQSIAVLEDLLKGFPFVDHTARSVALAALLTAAVRRSLPTAPLFIFDAPTHASGKTLLARVVARVVSGRDAAGVTFSGDPEEERKKLIAVLLAGDTVVCLDNISKPLEGDTLCSILTMPTVQDRRLGANEMITVPTHALFLATGNNTRVRGDLATRVLIARIDPGVEHPEERVFDRDLLAFVHDHRGRLVQAALAAMRAYVVAGRPPQPLKPFGRFEAWSDLVRATLVWLNCTDPCASRDQIEHDDPITADLGAVLQALKEEFKSDKFSTSQVIGAAMGGSTGLALALQAALPRGEIKPRSVGYYLRAHKDRIVGGLRICNAGATHGSTQWVIEG